MPKISIITVCRNNPTVEKTCESIVSQTFQDFEWIVVDGASDDGITLEILKKYESRINVLISEPDKGIYDAMNKGIRRATGDWLNFMNGGDAFASKTVLETIFGKNGIQIPDNVGVLYGDVFTVNGNKKSIQKFPKGMTFELLIGQRWSFNHQSEFIRREIFEKLGDYDTRFSIIADHKKNLEIKKAGYGFLHTELIVAEYDRSGFSAQNRTRTLAEKDTAAMNVFPADEVKKYFKTSVFLKRIRFLGLPLWERKFELEKNCEEIRIFGIPAFRKEVRKEFVPPKQVTNNLLSAELRKLELAHGGAWKTLIHELNIARAAKFPARALHSMVFPKYKGIHKDRDIVIVGAGPTLDKYKPLENAIHIGVNKTIFCEKIQFDYLFIQDYFGDLQETANNYRKNNCKKFYGYHQHPLVRPIPILDAKLANAERYFFQDLQIGTPNPFSPDISISPLNTFASVILPAIQFALWTKPKRLFLVGCDCSNLGYSSEIKNNTTINNRFKLNVDRLIYGWKQLKIFADKFYPETEIISVNPVGLRGLFHDWDQINEQ